MAVYSERERTRIVTPKKEARIIKHNAPEKDSPWIWLSEELLFSPSFTSLSVNALRCLFRILGEHSIKGRKWNGQLIVTHPDFERYGVTHRFIADGCDELVFKGLLVKKTGRAADGTAHPNLYRLTFLGDYEGNPPTHEWKNVGTDKALQWKKVKPQKAEERSKEHGRKKKLSLHKSEITRFPFVKSDINFERKAS
ncbi:hypothetical protein QFZ34_003268 [Phyllobacterium ifriqiyense]|uniref:Helix-turn-helix domain-containing protein n=1 Tax=Phyllobacterium ifriqiyense TaxID=314238 RepID=A0ABU0SBG4_9HYPH|nr:hypothetical protein [Phyllobacterium ifriqiyense]MDQ0998086.1 hypothetical protein [Phyllobacterium ifriqiyense]